MAYTGKDPNDDLLSQVSGYMRVGSDYETAMAACGVRKKQSDEWLDKAQKANEKQIDGAYLDLYETIRQSVAQAEVIALQRLSAEGGASGARHVLEIVRPEKYSKNGRKKGFDADSEDMSDWFN